MCANSGISVYFFGAYDLRKLALASDPLMPVTLYVVSNSASAIAHRELKIQAGQDTTIIVTYRTLDANEQA
jgi:hypothetical protein